MSFLHFSQSEYFLYTAAQKNLVTLYNTDITFQERLYATLDVDLTRVRLHQPLDVIVKLPLLYVRDMVPRLCLQAVLKLHDVSFIEIHMLFVIILLSFPNKHYFLSYFDSLNQKCKFLSSLCI